MAFLFFEGVDKTGKSTLIKEINKITNYQHFCVDRCLGSAFVYDLITGRRDRFSKLDEFERELSRVKSIPIITILLSCDSKILRKRIKLEDDDPQKTIKFLNKAIKAYNFYKKRTKIPLIEVNTTKKTIEETAKEIIKKIKKYER